jgi:transcription initiation factor TFIIB
MRRLRRWHVRSRLHTTFERNLSRAMIELERLSDKLKIPHNIRETAAVIYRKALGEGLVHGRSIAAFVAASIYTACRASNTPRTLKEVVKASPRSRKEVTRCYRLILREINPKLPIDHPMKYVPKIASKLNLNQKTQNKAVEILRDAKDEKIIVGKGPVGLAAASLYIAALLTGEGVTQEEVAEASDITAVTVRNRYKGLKKGLDYLNQLL